MPRAAVFTDPKGNRYVFHNMIQWDREDDISGLELNARAMSVALAIPDLKLDGKYHEFNEDHLPHLNGTLESNAFFHGYCDCMIIGGPMFDEAHKEFQSAENV